MSWVNLFQRSPFGPVMERLPLVALDVGSRGGFERDLEPIAFAVEAWGFEPDPQAFAAIAGERGPWRSLRHFPYGLSGSGGPRTLTVPSDPVGASLLLHDQAVGRRFNKMQFVTPAGTATVDTRTLDQATAEQGLDRVDYLKLDVEGAELEILRGGPRTLENVLVIKTEVAFLPVRHGQPLAHEVAAVLCGQGFELMDFIRPSHWRRHGAIIHPLVEAAQPLPYSRGQLIHGDYLLFRRPDTLTTVEARLRAAFLGMAHGFFDYAGELLEQPEVRDHLETHHGLDAMAAARRLSWMYGRREWASAFGRQVRGLSRFIRALPEMVVTAIRA
ncbi:MAG: FkbM family methyltransferase [Alphaproteobacteria bacterium]